MTTSKFQRVDSVLLILKPDPYLRGEGREDSWCASSSGSFGLGEYIRQYCFDKAWASCCFGAGPSKYLKEGILNKLRHGSLDFEKLFRNTSEGWHSRL